MIINIVYTVFFVVAGTLNVIMAGIKEYDSAPIYELELLGYCAIACVIMMIVMTVLSGICFCKLKSAEMNANARFYMAPLYQYGQAYRY